MVLVIETSVLDSVSCLSALNVGSMCWVFSLWCMFTMITTTMIRRLLVCWYVCAHADTITLTNVRVAFAVILSVFVRCNFLFFVLATFAFAIARLIQVYRFFFLCIVRAICWISTVYV